MVSVLFEKILMLNSCQTLNVCYIVMFQGRKTTTRAPPRRDEGRQTDRGNRLTENAMCITLRVNGFMKAPDTAW